MYSINGFINGQYAIHTVGTEKEKKWFWRQVVNDDNRYFLDNCADDTIYMLERKLWTEGSVLIISKNENNEFFLIWYNYNDGICERNTVFIDQIETPVITIAELNLRLR